MVNGFNLFVLFVDASSSTHVNKFVKGGKRLLWSFGNHRNAVAKAVEGRALVLVVARSR